MGMQVVPQEVGLWLELRPGVPDVRGSNGRGRCVSPRGVWVADHPGAGGQGPPGVAGFACASSRGPGTGRLLVIKIRGRVQARCLAFVKWEVHVPVPEELELGQVKTGCLLSVG